MAQVFAGFVAGYGIALLWTPLLAFLMVRLRVTSPFLGRLLPEGVSAVPLAVILHGALFLFWTAIGILLGLLLLAMKDARGSTSIANPAFTLLVASTTLMLLAPFGILLKQIRVGIVTAGLLVVLVFGLVMPLLADWTKFEEPVQPRKAPEVSWFA